MHTAFCQTPGLPAGCLSRELCTLWLSPWSTACAHCPPHALWGPTVCELPGDGDEVLGGHPRPSTRSPHSVASPSQSSAKKAKPALLVGY